MERKSPPEYKSAFQLLKYDTTKKRTPKKVPVKHIKLTGEIPQRSIVRAPKDSNIVYGNFKSFLCDLELFNWREEKSSHKALSSTTIYFIHILLLFKLFGNDISYFAPSLNFDKEKTNSEFSKLEDLKENTIINTQFYGLTMMTAISISKSSEDSKFYQMNYIPQLLEPQETRYSIFDVHKFVGNSGHLTMIFMDHVEKIIEFYDPHGRDMELSEIRFVYTALSEIFPEYKINEFWKLKGLQESEVISDDVEQGFCIRWTSMMIHLKLLNLTMSMEDIEKAFIKECYNKKLSMYEVMLNYAYLMRRSKLLKR
jgi:hypothetical protein